MKLKIKESNHLEDWKYKNVILKHVYDERFMYGAEMVKFNKSLQGKKSALSKQSCAKHVHINKELEMESLRPLLDLKHVQCFVDRRTVL